MKVLDVIRYITQHPEYTTIVIKDEDDMTPMQAIYYLASIDPLYFDSISFRINGTLEKNTLNIW